MAQNLLRWRDIYSETELYKAAVALYTKPVFDWRKAMSHSADGETFYDFARDGFANIAGLHKMLAREKFTYSPAVKLDFNLNGKLRSFYIYPWRERLTDLLLYRLLSDRPSFNFSKSSYAYRLKGGGVNRCQTNIRHSLAACEGTRYIVKRDIRNYFPSIDHDLLLENIARHIDEHDFLFRLLAERVRFKFLTPDGIATAERGVPFGTAAACFLSNLYLTPLDHEMRTLSGISYFRYADDFLVLADKAESAKNAADVLDGWIEKLRLSAKSTHTMNLSLEPKAKASLAGETYFTEAEKFRHLGLEFCAGGNVRLSRDKFRKLCNIFDSAFRRHRGKLRKIKDRNKRIAFAVKTAAAAATGVKRNVAIIDYYLTHVTDQAQLRLLDRWVAEEVLAVALGTGHKKGNFAVCGYGRLRTLGLPSLAHRARLIQHGCIAAPFFVRRTPAPNNLGTIARPAANIAPVFFPCPEAAALVKPVGKGGRLSAGVTEEINALR